MKATSSNSSPNIRRHSSVEVSGDDDGFFSAAVDAESPTRMFSPARLKKLERLKRQKEEATKKAELVMAQKKAKEEKSLKKGEPEASIREPFGSILRPASATENYGTVPSAWNSDALDSLKLYRVNDQPEHKSGSRQDHDRSSVTSAFFHQREEEDGNLSLFAYSNAVETKAAPAATENNAAVAVTAPSSSDFLQDWDTTCSTLYTVGDESLYTSKDRPIYIFEGIPKNYDATTVYHPEMMADTSFLKTMNKEQLMLMVSALMESNGNSNSWPHPDELRHSDFPPPPPHQQQQEEQQVVPLPANAAAVTEPPKTATKDKEINVGILCTMPRSVPAMPVPVTPTNYRSKKQPKDIDVGVLLKPVPVTPTFVSKKKRLQTNLQTDPANPMEQVSSSHAAPARIIPSIQLVPIQEDCSQQESHGSNTMISFWDKHRWMFWKPKPKSHSEPENGLCPPTTTTTTTTSSDSSLVEEPATTTPNKLPAATATTNAANATPCGGESKLMDSLSSLSATEYTMDSFVTATPTSLEQQQDHCKVPHNRRRPQRRHSMTGSSPTTKQRLIRPIHGGDTTSSSLVPNNLDMRRRRRRRRLPSRRHSTGGSRTSTVGSSKPSLLLRLLGEPKHKGHHEGRQRE